MFDMDATSVCNFVFKKKLHKSKKPGVSVTLIYACLLLSGGGRIIILIWYFSLSLFPILLSTTPLTFLPSLSTLLLLPKPLVVCRRGSLFKHGILCGGWFSAQSLQVHS